MIQEQTIPKTESIGTNEKSKVDITQSGEMPRANKPQADETIQTREPYQYECDVLVVGSGAGGLTAALTAADLGNKVLLIESTEYIGGCSAMSGGGFWIPNNPVMKREGVEDSYEDALTYMNGIIEYDGPASSPERREAYLKEGVAMTQYLLDQGMELYYSKGYPDYYPDKVGGNPVGRCLDGGIYNANNLPKEWRDKLRGAIPIPMRATDAAIVSKAFSGKGMKRLMSILFKRMIGGSLTGKKNVGMGVALVGRLLEIALDKGVSIWLESPLEELIVEEGEVQGALVSKEGEPTRVRANKGVILAAGGFSHNRNMRQKYHPHPIGTDWTSASPGDRGGGILAGMDIDAETALMDDAWWGPTFINADGSPQFMIWERSNPYSIIVDSAGKRFMNESASYVDCGHWMYEHNAEVPCIPSYMIIDSNHRRNYMLGMLPPKMTPKTAFESGFLTKGETLQELADKIGVNPNNLMKTVEEFNAMCATGKDTHYQRGDTAYDRFYSDDEVKPNPNLGEVKSPPFYSIKVWPGDLSTKGGLLSDEYARVIAKDGRLILGLYVTGNNSASVMGRTYPGPGATIGATMTFGYIAAKDIAAHR